MVWHRSFATLPRAASPSPPSYTCPTDGGPFSLEIIMLHNQKPVGQSPYSVFVEARCARPTTLPPLHILFSQPKPSDPRGFFSEVGGRGAVCGGVGFTSVATVVAMDQYRNRRTRGGDKVEATLTWTRIDGSRHRCAGRLLLRRGLMLFPAAVPATARPLLHSAIRFFSTRSIKAADLKVLFAYQSILLLKTCCDPL